MAEAGSPQQSRVRPPGYDRRVRSPITGYSQKQGPVRDFSGLNEFYALQNRNVPAFSQPGGRNTIPSAGEFASQFRNMGVNLDRSGTVQPLGYNQFRQELQGARAPGATFQDVQSLVTPNSGEVDYSITDAVSRLGRGQTASAPAATPEQNRANLSERAAGLNLLRSTTNPVQTSADGSRSLNSRYGTGSSTPMRAPGQVGMINGRPAAETLQGLANAQGRAGTSRPGDRFQPQGDMKPAEIDKLRNLLAKRTPGRTL